MRSLILFFQRHHLLFLFLILEGTAFALLFRNNYIQRIEFIKAGNIVSGMIYEQMDKWRDYIYLKEINQQLIDENIQLRNMLDGAYYHIEDSVHYYKNDSIQFLHYAYFPAKIVNNEVQKQYNFITINRGKQGGVDEDMAVICPQGIVGIVYGVNDLFATVMPVINRNFRISAKFKKNDYFGSLTWDGHSYRYATLNEVPLHIPVSLGDTIVVSGYSSSFPEGIPVGTVEKIDNKDGSFYHIDILLATDFRKLNYVTVVEDILKKEQLELEQQTKDMQ